MRAWIRSVVALAAALTAQCGVAVAEPEVTVFAAASLKNALDAIAMQFHASTGRRVAVSYAASSALAKQIEQGAPADIFISADQDWMDYLQQKGLVDERSRRNLLGNRLVLVAPAAEATPVVLRPGGLTAALAGGRLAIASVSAVPAGKYGKAALEQLGLWDEVSARLAQTENVRAALAFVARGEAPLGLVYETDATAEPKVGIVARLPATSHPPIVYPVALTRLGTKVAPARFLDELRSPGSTEIFAREGFTVLD